MPKDQIVSSTYGNKVRVRVCGILLQDNQLLLAKHKPFGPAGELWIPPGGGMNYGQHAKQNLVREFIEETNLEIEVGKLLFTNETIHPPFHSIELFYLINQFKGQLKLGIDPEMAIDEQILNEVKFMSEEEINSIPIEMLHYVFKFLKNKDGLISFDALLKMGETYILDQII